MASSLQMLIRTLFGIAEHISPQMAGRAGFELFCRTRNPNRIGENEKSALVAHKPLMDQARRHFLPIRGGGAVAVHVFDPKPPVRSRGVALVIHGWHSRSDHMGSIIGELLKRGLRVVALDLPGHGQSLGRRLHMANAVAAVRATADRYGPLQAIVGHSFGGAVAVNSVAGSVVGMSPVETDRLILIAAPNSMPAYFAQFSRFVGLGRNSAAVAVKRIKQIAGRPFHTYVSAAQLARTLVPTLLIHAPDDKEVPAADASAMVRAGSHVRLAWAPGLGHRRILSDPEVLAKVGMFAQGGQHLQAVA